MKKLFRNRKVNKLKMKIKNKLMKYKNNQFLAIPKYFLVRKKVKKVRLHSLKVRKIF
jgi:hypothetical protein